MCHIPLSFSIVACRLHPSFPNNTQHPSIVDPHPAFSTTAHSFPPLASPYSLPRLVIATISHLHNLSRPFLITPQQSTIPTTSHTFCHRTAIYPPPSFSPDSIFKSAWATYSVHIRTLRPIAENGRELEARRARRSMAKKGRVREVPRTRVGSA